jgi:hypothetical protein
MVERHVMSRHSLGLVPECEGVKMAVNTLMPLGNDVSIWEKFALNAVSLDGDVKQSGLFVNMSRVNHDCLGNSSHKYVPKHNVMILIANRDIKRGEEITFNYIANKRERKHDLTEKWSFTCHCRACSDPAIEAKMRQIEFLDNQVEVLGLQAKFDEAIQCAKDLIPLYDELGYTSLKYSRTYYDLYTQYIYRQSTILEAFQYIKLAYEAECSAYAPCQDTTCGEIVKFRNYLHTPTSHRNFEYGCKYLIGQ